MENIDWLNSAGNIKEVLNADYDWEWLPSTRDQSDPFGESLKEALDANDKECLNQIYKSTLSSLRSVGQRHAKLIDGPHNYTEAFRGAALYAARKATQQRLINNTESRWVEIFEHYKKGKWPCGIRKNGELVIL